MDHWGPACELSFFFILAWHQSGTFRGGGGFETVLPQWKLELCAPWIVAEAFETVFNYKSILKDGARNESFRKLSRRVRAHPVRAMSRSRHIIKEHVFETPTHSQSVICMCSSSLVTKMFQILFKQQDLLF